MKVLIAVCSCQGDAENGNHDAIRSTWGKDVAAAGADLRFFVGRRSPDYQPKPDEVLIDWEQPKTCEHPWWQCVEGCCIDYWQKNIKENLRWSLQQGYDFTFECENDTFMVPSKLMALDFARYDISGCFFPLDTPIGTRTTYQMWPHSPTRNPTSDWRVYPYPNPGVGYFLSRKAAEIVLNATPSHWDIGPFTGQALGPAIESGEIWATNLDDLWNNASFHYRDVHNSESYFPGCGWQYEMYEKHGKFK
jgi:hypothetical protein